jgi:hypothetical protein
MATPHSPQFNWRKIGVFGPYGLMIRCFPHQADSFDAGDINNGTSNLGINYTLFVNAGRTGSPGLEVTVTMAATNTNPRVTVTIFFEPGVHVRKEDDEELYNLQVADTQFLGLSGGGGHIYDQDPPAVHQNVPNAQRKETLRIKLVSHGHVCHDPDGLAAIRARLPPVSADGRMIAAMTSTRGTSASAFRAWFYCRVPTPMIQNFTQSVLFWFRWMFGQRCLPLFQYPAASLSLNMDPLPGFRNSMYCNIVTQHGVQVLGDPALQIADTIGGRNRRTRAVGNSVALIRENQGHEAFCIDIGKNLQQMRLIRSNTPVLSKPTRLLTVNNALPAIGIPEDMLGYFGYIYIRTTSRTFPIATPLPGSLFLITFCTNVDGRMQRTGKIVYGMVLAADPAIISTGASFAVALWIRDPGLRQTAQNSVNSAPLSPIELRFVQNRQVPQIMLSGMVRFAGFSTTKTVQALHVTVFRQMGTSSVHDDLHQGPRPPLDNPDEMTRLDGVFQNFARTVQNSPLMANIRPVENYLLLNIPGQIFGKCQLVRTTIGANSFRAVYGLILILVGMGHRIILIVDEPDDRSRVCWDLFNLFQQTGTMADHYGRTWRSKRLLSYSSTDVEYQAPSPEQTAAARSDLSHPGNPLRPALDLFFKMLLDDLPSHAHMHDLGALYNAPATAPPAYQTPQAMSWVDHFQIHCNLNTAYRAQHFADRARVLDGNAIGVDDANAILGRLGLTRRTILSKADVVVCDSATAMSSDVRATFLDPLIFLGNSHRMDFTKGASILLQHPGYIAAFILGNLNDQRHGRVVFASEGRNEAMLTMRRSLWETYVWAGRRVLDLV